MCGITGCFNKKINIDKSIIISMTRVISHRGPDDEGVWCEGNIGLGHRRLSILDLSPAGHQPMISDNGRFVIVFNGEIYNFDNIKKEILKKEYHFSSYTDTEVLLALYKEKRYDTPKYLNGIFAFAIWDKERKELFVARDHFGVKPLYYYLDNDKFVFGSEIKSLIQLNSIKREIDIKSLDTLLTLRFIPAPKTIFKSIYKLEPGHFMVVNSNLDLIKKSYWDYIPQPNSSLSEKDYILKYQELLFKAVKRQMISDAPLGLSLSAGVDSGVILSIMSEISPKPIKAFTIGFKDGENINEISGARITANKFGAEFYPMTVTSKDYFDFFEDYLWHLEEPTGNESAAAVNFISRLANKQVKVLLTGQGADELLAGYPRYIGEKYGYFYRLFTPKILRMALVNKNRNTIGRNQKLINNIFSLGNPDISSRFLQVYSIINKNTKDLLYNKSLKKFALTEEEMFYPFEKVRQNFKAKNSLEQMLNVDLRTSLTDNLLMCGDKMSMAASIEARVPFLDIELVEFLLTIPTNLKLKGITRKYIHKKAVKKWLPDEIIYRKKIGFKTPMDKWLQQRMPDFIKEFLNDNDSITSQFFNKNYLEKIISLHVSGKVNYNHLLFLLVSIEMWNQKFILNK